MKTTKVFVNKTEQNPKGTEIDLVQPETDLEARLLCYLLTGTVREAKSNNRIPYKLPAEFKVEHRGEGTFAVVGTPGPSEKAVPVPGGGYYQAPRPLAIVGIRSVSATFELIHAELNAETLKRAAEAQKMEQEAKKAGAST